MITLPNAYMLSMIYEHCKKNKLITECEKIVRLSPVAWQHINFVGRYEFTNDVVLPNMNDMIGTLVENLDKVVIVVNTKNKRKHIK